MQRWMIGVGLLAACNGGGLPEPFWQEALVTPAVLDLAFRGDEAIALVKDADGALAFATVDIGARERSLDVVGALRGGPEGTAFFGPGDARLAVRPGDDALWVYTDGRLWRLDEAALQLEPALDVTPGLTGGAFAFDTKGDTLIIHQEGGFGVVSFSGDTPSDLVGLTGGAAFDGELGGSGATCEISNDGDVWYLQACDRAAAFPLQLLVPASGGWQRLDYVDAPSGSFTPVYPAVAGGFGLQQGGAGFCVAKTAAEGGFNANDGQPQCVKDGVPAYDLGRYWLRRDGGALLYAPGEGVLVIAEAKAPRGATRDLGDVTWCGAPNSPIPALRFGKGGALELPGAGQGTAELLYATRKWRTRGDTLTLDYRDNEIGIDDREVRYLVRRVNDTLYLREGIDEDDVGLSASVGMTNLSGFWFPGTCGG